MFTTKIFEALKALYTTGLASSDAKAISSFLNDRGYEKLVSSPEKYLEILHLRSNAFLLYGKLIAAGEEYRKGYTYCEEKDKCIYCFNWALIFLAELNLERGGVRIKSSFNKGVEALEKAILVIPNNKDAVYYELAINSLKSFMLLSMGKVNEAKECLKSSEFIPVPISDFNNKANLKFLFSNYMKGLAVAIELKDKDLLLKMLNVIAVNDHLMKSDASLYEKFYDTLISTFDMRSEFSNEFNSLFKIKNKIKLILPNFELLLSLIGEQKYDNLALFFNEFK